MNGDSSTSRGQIVYCIVTSCGLGLNNEVRHSSYRLTPGIKLTPVFMFRNDRLEGVPWSGLQTICGQASRHFATNRPIFMALLREDTPSTKEPPRMFRRDEKRLDGVIC